MTTPAHFFGGYLVLSLSKNLWFADTLSAKTQKWLFTYGLILSLAIDLDVLITRGITDHHKQLTHFPLFWLITSMIVLMLGRIIRKPSVQSVGIVTLIASWTHLTLDLVGVTMGIHLLWPFSLAEFSLTPLKTNFLSEQARIAYIFSSPVMWVGDGVIILAGIIKIILDFKYSKNKL